MDLITSFPRIARQHVSIIVIVDKSPKVAHFIPMKSTFSATDVAQVLIRYMVKLHGVSKNIVLGMDTKFTSKFWKELFVGFPSVQLIIHK